MQERVRLIDYRANMDDRLAWVGDENIYLSRMYPGRPLYEDSERRVFLQVDPQTINRMFDASDEQKCVYIRVPCTRRILPRSLPEHHIH